MLLRIATENKECGDAVVSDYEMEKIIILLQEWGVAIKNPFEKEVNEKDE